MEHLRMPRQYLRTAIYDSLQLPDLGSIDNLNEVNWKLTLK